MEEQKNSIQEYYRFGLYLGNPSPENEVYTRIIGAKECNHTTRYNIDLKPINNDIMNKIKDLVCNDEYETQLDYYDSDDQYYDTSKDYRQFMRLYKIKHNESKFNLPPEEHYDVKNTNKSYTGVRITYGVYLQKIDDDGNKEENPIIERFLFLKKVNSMFRFSKEMMDTCDEIFDMIVDQILKQEKNRIWEDKDIIETYSLNTDAIKGLDEYSRKKLLSGIKELGFVNRVRNKYKEYKNSSDPQQVFSF